MSRRLLWIAAILAGLSASPLAAQIEGVVVEPAGTPVEGATVEVWSASVLHASRATDSRGRFRFPDEQTRDAQTVVVRRLGFETIRRPVSTGNTLLEIVLTPASVGLAELQVQASRRPCPRADDPVARAVWSSAARRYSRETGRRGFDALVWSATEHRSPEQTGEVDDARLRPGGRVWSGDSTSVFDANERVHESGYARPLPWNQPGYQPIYADYFAWRYPDLHAYDAYHFASREFGERHTLAFLDRTTDGFVLAFCPVRKDQPYIEGWLAIGSDTAFESAEWKFFTPKPNESAGGRVTFDTAWVAGEELPHLVPARGVFWRRMTGRSLYYQSAADYPAWIVSENRSRPEIERRAGRPSRPGTSR
jgi:hypothetical protein